MISIVFTDCADGSTGVPSDGGSQIARSISTIARQRTAGYEAVVVSADPESITEALRSIETTTGTALEIVSVEIASGTSVGEMREAGVAASRGEMLTFCEPRVRLGLDFTRIVDEICGKGSPDIVTVHLSMRDADLDRYTSTRPCTRDGKGRVDMLMPTSLSAAKKASMCKMVAGMVFSRDLIGRVDGAFRAVHQLDGDPHTLELLMSAGSVATAPWVLAARDTSACAEQASLDSATLRARVASAVSVSLDNGDAGAYWTALQTSMMIESCPNHLSEELFDLIVEMVHPLEESVLGADWGLDKRGVPILLGEGSELGHVRAAGLSRRELLGLCTEFRERELLARCYQELDSMHAANLERAAGGDFPESVPRKRRGLFRR